MAASFAVAQCTRVGGAFRVRIRLRNTRHSPTRLVAASIRQLVGNISDRVKFSVCVHAPRTCDMLPEFLKTRRTAR